MKFGGKELRRKNIVYPLEYDRERLEQAFQKQEFKEGLRYTMKCVTEVLDDVDDYLLDRLYDTYRGTDISKVFVIDKKQFEHFLAKYLPTYINETNKEIDEKVKQAIELRKLYLKGEEDED